MATTTYLYQGSDGDNLLLERKEKENRVVIRRQYEGTTLPLLKCSPMVLQFMFSNLYMKHTFRHAVKIDKEDTKFVINYELGETQDTSAYKPSAVIHYRFKLNANEDISTMTLSFEVFYHLWKRTIDEDTGNYTMVDVVTETKTYSYDIGAEDYLKLLAKITTYDASLVEGLWYNATNQGFIMDFDYDFGDMDVEDLEEIFEDYDFGEG